MPVKFASVVHALAGRGIGHLLRPDEIQAADFIARHRHVEGALVNKALDQVGRFRATCTPIGVNGSRVGINAAKVHGHQWNIIDACCHGNAKRRDIGTIGVKIRTHCRDEIDLDRKEFPLLVHRHSGYRDIVAAMGIHHEMLGAVGCPLHRFANTAGSFHGQRIFAIGKDLGAETATNIGGSDADVLLLDAEDIHHHVANAVDALRTDNQ